MEKITSRAEYDAVKVEVERLIGEATEKGMLEPDMDNEYTKEIARLGLLMEDYEDNVLEILPLRKKSPLIAKIEDYSYEHNLKRKEIANILGINESVFSQILNGKRKISMPVAKKLHSNLGIDANLILDYA